MNDKASQGAAAHNPKLVKAFGFEMHNPVFFVSAALILLFSILTLVFPDAANQSLQNAKAWTLRKFDWFYAITPIIILALCICIAVSPLGKIRLGGENAKADYSVGSWIAMLFAAGVGIGFMFYGSAEPLGYYTNWFGTPFNVEAGTPEAQRLAYTTSLFHWGLFAWSIYAIVGLALAFFAFNRGLPLTIRSAFYPIFGDKIWGWPGHIIDMFAVVSTIFGLACTIGIGATQATGGLSYMFGLTPSTGLQIALIFVITLVAIGSVLRGMNGGIKLLSNINMTGATLLLVFVIIAGPTATIFKSIGQTAIHSIPDSIRLANWIGRPDQQFLYDWTIFYWAWWIAWSPFVGMFIARISKGRTIRQFMGGVLMAPLAIGLIWFTAFGETAISQYQSKTGDLAGGMGDASLVLFQMLGSLPLSGITSGIAIILLIIFIVTSADFGALVVDSLTSGGQTTSPVRQRVFWAAMLGLTAIALLYGGGDEALKALQAGTITAALPFTIIVLLYGVCLVIGLRDEVRQNKGNDA
ncbi:MAG: BCCT family transporter [Maricaulaceae bacterium]